MWTFFSLKRGHRHFWPPTHLILPTWFLKDPLRGALLCCRYPTSSIIIARNYLMDQFCTPLLTKETKVHRFLWTNILNTDWIKQFWLYPLKFRYSEKDTKFETHILLCFEKVADFSQILWASHNIWTWVVFNDQSAQKFATCHKKTQKFKIRIFENSLTTFILITTISATACCSYPWQKMMAFKMRL